VLVPAVFVGAALWFVDLGGAQASVFLLPALISGYLVGYACIGFARSLGFRADAGFYAVFAVAAVAGALVGGAFLGASPQQAAGTMLLPLLLAFAFPALFEAGMELMKNVQSA
jgi:hypothetical protein